jgi:DNA polymerase III delta subunit
MIYILSGDDSKIKSSYINKLTKNREVIFAQTNDGGKDLVLNYARGVSLFGDSPVVISENFLKDGDIDFSDLELKELKESKTIFIFKEDKMLATDQKKYKKYGEVEVFELKKITKNEKFNPFLITDAFANRDKIMAWTSYLKCIEEGAEPEAIAGVLFWKIKTMMLNGSKAFSKDELKRQSSLIVSIYHKAHRGEVDFVVGIEQFLLSSLSSK